jgi:hypothetical protein
VRAEGLLECGESKDKRFARTTRSSKNSADEGKAKALLNK